MKWTLKLIVAALSLGTALSRAEDASFTATTAEIVTMARKQAPDLAAEKACLEKIIGALSAKELEANEIARKEPQNALDKLEFVVSRPGAEKEREAFCAVISEKLGGALHTPAKVWLLKSLERIGKAESVGAEIKLLADADPLVSETARRALAANPADAAAADLRKAIEGAADPKARAALVEALAFKLNKADVALFETSFANPDPGVHAAAVGALASQHIRKETGVMEQAAELVDAGRDGGAAGISKIIAALASDNAKLRQAAIQGATFNTAPEMTTALTGALKTANPDVKPALIAVISQRADKASVPALLEEIKNPDPLVRTAVISGIANFSDSSAFAPLMTLARTNGSEDQRVARECLDRIKSPEVDEKLVAMLSNSDVELVKEALQRLAARNALSSAPAVLKLLASPDATVQSEALKTLGSVGVKDSLDTILSTLTKAGETTDVTRDAAVKALIAISKRLPESDGHVEIIAKAAHDAGPNAHVALIAALGQIGGPKALEAVHETLKDSNEALHEAAFRSLASWSDAAPMNEMLEQTKSAKDETHRVLALRAFVRMAALPGTHTPKETLDLFAGAKDAIKTPDDRKLILNAMSEIRDFGAVEASAQFITDPTVSEEACIATIKGCKRYDNGQHGDRIPALMKDVLTHAKNKSTKDQAQAVLDKASKK